MTVTTVDLTYSAVYNRLQQHGACGSLAGLGATLRAARRAAGISLSAMATRTHYAKSTLGLVETGKRTATPAIIRAYESVLGDDLRRRAFLIGAATAAVPGAAPDVAVDVVRDIVAERSRLLATVQTSHEIDRTIGYLVAQDAPALGSLSTWMRRGTPILRVNAAGILAKVGSPVLDDEVVRSLRGDQEVRHLYLTAVCARLLRMPWDDAGCLAVDGNLAERDLSEFATEISNPADAGARWCSLLMIARMRLAAPRRVREALGEAIKTEPSREILRSMAGVLAGRDPLTV